MDQDGIFKTTTFGGFDKKSVLTYIDALTEKHHADEEELRRQIAEFSKAQDSQVDYIQKLESQLEELEDKLDAVADQLESERAATPQAASQINDLNCHNQELEQKLSDMERELNIQLERNRQLQFKVEGAVYKSQKYDELSAQVGDAMLVAKANADKILAQAQESADKLLEEAHESVERLHAEAREALSVAERDSTQILIDAQAQADALKQQTTKDAAREIEQAQAKAAEITQQAQEHLKHFGGEIGSFCGDTSRLRKSIEEILFVLNDRVDVMQEIVRHMDVRADALLDESKQTTAFEKTSDEAGYFGGSI